MDVSDRFFALLERFEGFRAHKYRDTAGKWTIGIGHLVQVGETFPEPITRTYAETLLRHDAQVAVAAVNRLVTVPLTQDQFDALVSFTYNVGQGHLASSTLLARLNAGHYDEVPHELARWTAGGVPGLVARRAAEAALFRGDQHA